MTDATTSSDGLWSRPLWLPGEPMSFDAFERRDAYVHLVVFGATADELTVDPSAYAVEEIPEGIEADDLGPEWIEALFEPPMGDVLREPDPLVAALAETSDRAIAISGTVDDPSTLGYLRDCVGIATAALDTGGIGVLSLQSLALFSPDRWREQIFDGGPEMARRLVAVLYSDGGSGDGSGEGEADGHLWVHTRGLRLFGRPDLGIRGVPVEQLDAANRLCHALVERLARGLVIEDGASMEVGAGLGTVTFARRGSLEDPEFNNVHLAIDWPSA